MAEGGGTGVTTRAVRHTLAQARYRWGDDAVDAIWDAATVTCRRTMKPRSEDAVNLPIGRS